MARQPSEPRDQWADAPRVFLAGIVATGLAAALGAVLTSVVGVQGTVVGAMIGAMIVSGLSQVVRLPLARLERWLIQVGIIAVRRKRPLRRAPRASSQAPTRPPGGGRRALAIGVLGFLLGIAAISGFEIVQGKPLSATTRHQQETGTTIGHLVQDERHGAPPTAAPATEEPPPAAPAASPVPTSGLEESSPATSTGSATSPTATIVAQPTAVVSPTRLLPTPTPPAATATQVPRGQTPTAPATLAATVDPTVAATRGPAPATPPPQPTPSPPRPSASPPAAATASGTSRPGQAAGLPQEPGSGAPARQP